MKRKYSLKGKTSFDRVFKYGKRYRGNGIFCIYLEENADFQESDKSSDLEFKLGIIITKKFGKAFKRIKEKRRVRDIFRSVIDQYQPGGWLVVRIFNEFEEKNFCEKKREVLCLLKKANIIE